MSPRRLCSSNNSPPAPTKLAALPAEARRDLYLQIRAVTRQLVLKNPLIGSHPILFMQRNRAVGYMLYEYLGWYYTYGYDPTNGARIRRLATPPTGGGVYVLEEPGRSFKTTQLTGGELPPGHFVTLHCPAMPGRSTLLMRIRLEKIRTIRQVLCRLSRSTARSTTRFTSLR